MKFSVISQLSKVVQPFIILFRAGWYAILIILSIFCFALFSSFGPDDTPANLKPLKQFYLDYIARYYDFAPLFPWILLLLICIFALQQRKQIDKAKRNRRHSEEIARSFRVYSQSYHDCHDQLLEAVEQATATASDLVFDAKPHMRHLCNCAAELFKDLTGKTCHCTIKIKRIGDDKIFTLVRDTLTANADRAALDTVRHLYSYTQDTGFSVILKRPDASYFFSNDLAALVKNGRYNNGNEGWNSRYNATVIVPITREAHSERITEEDTLGFFTVDSLEGEFQERVAVEVMRYYAWHAFSILDILGRLERKSFSKSKREIL